jgi:hypothetical protein
MQLTLDHNFLGEWAEPGAEEYQPLLDFESEIQDEGKFADVDFLTNDVFVILLL